MGETKKKQVKKRKTWENRGKYGKILKILGENTDLIIPSETLEKKMRQMCENEQEYVLFGKYPKYLFFVLKKKNQDAHKGQ